MANFEAAISRRGGAIVRCAVYTRKSSEEGLEQDFNSLHRHRPIPRTGHGFRFGLREQFA